MQKISDFIAAFFLAIAMLVPCGQAFAQDAPDVSNMVTTSTEPKEAQSGFSGDALVQQVISNLVQTIVAGFRNLEEKVSLKDAGSTILYLLVAILLAWAAVKAMVGNGLNSFIEEMMAILLTLAVIEMFLNSGGIDGIEKFIDSIASGIAGSNLSGLENSLKTVVLKTFNAVLDIITMPSIESSSGWNMVKVLVAIPQTIMQILAKFIAASFLVMSCGIFIANIVLAYGSIIIAKVLAPIMIPWLLLSQASFMFDGWLRFFIGSCLFKVVGAFFIQLTSNWIDNIALISKNVKVDTNVDALALYSGNLLVYAAIIMLAATSAYMMMMVPGIASGLLSGSSGKGFSGTAAMTNGAGFKGIARGTGAGSRGVTNVSKDAFNAGMKLAKKFV